MAEVIELKLCTSCKEEKPSTEFFRKSGSDLPRSYCKLCSMRYNRAWNARNPETALQYSRNSNRKRKFGISLEKYNEMLQIQDGVCAICRDVCPSGRQLTVDHDHDTGCVRGLLCMPCNLILGHTKDSSVRLRAAADYLDMRRDGWT